MSSKTFRIAIFNRNLEPKIKVLLCWDQPFLAGWVFCVLLWGTIFNWLVDQIFQPDSKQVETAARVRTSPRSDRVSSEKAGA